MRLSAQHTHPNHSDRLSAGRHPSTPTTGPPRGPRPLPPAEGREENPWASDGNHATGAPAGFIFEAGRGGRICWASLRATSLHLRLRLRCGGGMPARPFALPRPCRPCGPNKVQIRPPAGKNQNGPGRFCSGCADSLERTRLYKIACYVLLNRDFVRSESGILPIMV